ncbi:glycine/D-amino acid oxidase-like deaminating enzyme [Paraburkholderia sp. GAS199]|uniref:NAD(P)/FAD-dependent oxidoreductase n=1 Tax=Paraburkholderia sp. GAS199 TaxID=3035126 RepID=UPI003D242F9C
MTRPDVIVVGAGIVGAACAYELAQRGARVQVFDQAGIGGGVTAAGMGHVAVMDDSPAEFALSAWSRELWLDLSARLDSRHAFTRCGTLWVAADDEEYALAETRHAALRQRGIASEVLDAQQMRDAEPALRDGLRGGMIVGDDCVVYAPTVAAWLLAQCGAGHIDVRLDTAVTRVDEQGVVLASGERCAAGSVLIANGLQAMHLLPDLPMQAKKGHLLITDRYPGMVRHQILELGYIKSAHNTSGTSVAFNVQPRPTGQLLIGSSRQFDSVDPAVEPAILGRMLTRAADYMPGLASLQAIRAWTGFRPATHDGLPLIGPAAPFLPRGCHASTWLATGHEGLGVTTALATGRLIAAQMLATGESLPIDPSPYFAARTNSAGQETAHA